MNFELSRVQQELKLKFKAFVDAHIVPFAGQFDREERLSDEILQELKASGYLGALIPEEYGGMGLDMVTLGILHEEMGRGCASVRSLLTVHGMVALAIMKWGNDVQKRHWLPRMACGEVIAAFGLSEPNAGSDANSITTSAVRQEDGFVLNGKKKWITMAQIADLFLVFAQVDGKPSVFLTDRNNLGLSIRPFFGLLGARASMVAELHFNDCSMPADRLLGALGSGITHVALSCLNYGRYTVAWGCVGLAQACVDLAVDYVQRRSQFGRLLKENQLIQKMITEMTVDCKAARWLCYYAGSLQDKRDPNSIMETWVAKYFAANMAGKSANKTVQIHGAVGCQNDHPAERLLRDSKINEIIEGTTQIHEIIIAEFAMFA